MLIFARSNIIIVFQIAKKESHIAALKYTDDFRKVVKSIPRTQTGKQIEST